MSNPSAVEQLRRQTERERERYLRIVELAPDAIFTVERERITYANRASLQLFAATCVEELIGRDPLDFFDEEQREGIRAKYRHIAERPGEAETSTEMLRRLDGTVVPIELRAVAYLNESGELVAQSSYHDLSDNYAAEQRIRYLAHHDVTTGLRNRHFFEEHISELLAVGRMPFLLLSIGIDGFADFNDSYGLHFGDRVLCCLSEIVQEVVAERGEQATLMRHRGDEFMLLLEDEGDLAAAEAIAIALQERFARPLEVEQRELYVSVSIGAAGYPQHGTELDELLRCVDTAMHEVKREGGAGFHVFRSEMAEKLHRHMRLEADLRAALRGGSGLSLAYQPIVRLESGVLDAAEALLRWEHPEFGQIAPDVFIPISEESGLAVELGSWVLREAVSQLRTWQDADLPEFSVAINVSALQFSHHDFASEAIAVLEEAGVLPEQLKIELTETAIAKSLDRVREQLGRLRDHGVESAIDDYGTGYSNLGYLQDLPTVYIKIDRSFIAELRGDGRSNSDVIVSNVIDVVHGLRSEVIAEGVETVEQLEILRGFGCDYVQGWATGRPVTAAELADRLRRDPVLLPHAP